MHILLFSLSLNGEETLRCKSILSGKVLCLHSQGAIKMSSEPEPWRQTSQAFRTLGPNRNASCLYESNQLTFSNVFCAYSAVVNYNHQDGIQFKDTEEERNRVSIYTTKWLYKVDKMFSKGTVTTQRIFLYMKFKSLSFGAYLLLFPTPRTQVTLEHRPLLEVR